MRKKIRLLWIIPALFLFYIASNIEEIEETEQETVKEESVKQTINTEKQEETILESEDIIIIAPSTEGQPSLSEEEYKKQCIELFYDEIFFGKDNLNGEHVKLHIFLSEEYYFTVDDLYSATLSVYMEQYSLKRDFFKCCVLREGENSYVGRQINMWFSDDFDLEPSDFQTGDKVVVYADVINWSNNTWDGYNSVVIIPRYVESE